MLAVLTCIATAHDVRFVALAWVICCIGALVVIALFARMPGTRPLVRAGWIFLTALVASSAIWCTHFVAILGFDPGARVTFDPVLTIISFIVATGGTMLGLAIASMPGSGRAAPVGGAIFGLGIAAMHYIGVTGYHVAGVITWDRAMVLASVVLATLLSSLALATARRLQGTPWIYAAMAPMVMAVLALHFTGMTAMHVTVLNRTPAEFQGAQAALALACAVCMLLILGVGIFTWIIDRAAQSEAHAQVIAANLTDAQTGLPNRAGYDIELERRCAQADPAVIQISVLFKLNNFETIMQSHGQEAAEQIVRKLAMRMDMNRASTMFLARLDRSEIAAIVRRGSLDGLREQAEQMLALLTIPISVGEATVSIDGRMGIAHFPANGQTPGNLLRSTRLALQSAMDDPLQRVCLFDELQDPAIHRRHCLVSDLPGATERGELALHFQPQVRVADRRVVGYEALLRWNHPQFGAVSPNEFIPLAEQTGDILAIGDWVLETACRTAAEWPGDTSIAVNVSPLQLRRPDFAGTVHLALVRSGLTPDRLEIELTESLLIDDHVRALHVLRGIRALGVRLVLDDFGAGHSSLKVLRQFPFDKIKLDKSFLDAIETCRQAQAILHAMLGMGRDLGIPMLVEGVETETELAILRAEGCERVQGYLTGRPTPEPAITTPWPLVRFATI